MIEGSTPATGTGADKMASKTADELSEDNMTINQMYNDRMPFKLNKQVDPEMSSFNQVFSIDD